jgi:hypothetical protein
VSKSDKKEHERSVILPGEGVTAAERRLAQLCRRSFLSLWSYPAVFRDQGQKNGGDGKEICDLLVVFENHIIIFSDKDCEFRDTGDLEREWRRWYKKAVLKSAEQVFGAQRWIHQFPNRLFLDRKCKVPFPIALPDPNQAVFHRIVVAHNGARRCREMMGGSGSLMLNNVSVGNAHFDLPFTIGQIDPEKGFVHVFDDTTLDIVMSTLDTISDFIAYLAKKEQFLTGERMVSAAGEEELLAVYFRKLNSSGEHDFVIKGDYDGLAFTEGFWKHFVSSPERRAQVEQDRISYSWDALIEKFVFHAMTDTQYSSNQKPLNEQEIMFRLMAREPRTRRRLLATSLHEVLERSVQSQRPWDARVMAPSHLGDSYYVFLCVSHLSDMSDEEYRNIRLNLLSEYCQVVKLKWPDATKIVGIATESGLDEQRSEDLIYLDAADWNAEAEAQARENQSRLGLLKEMKLNMSRVHEYPVDHRGKARNTTLSRNSSCGCGSGKRFKRCCGKELF